MEYKFSVVVGIISRVDGILEKIKGYCGFITQIAVRTDPIGDIRGYSKSTQYIHVHNVRWKSIQECHR